jgi:hypothetical protein
MDEKKLRKYAGLTESKKLEEQFKPQGFLAQIEDLAKRARKDKRLVLEAIDLAEDEESRAAREAETFLFTIEDILDNAE